MFYRGRRLRTTKNMRLLVEETKLHKEELIYPIFVVEGNGIKNEISSLKNCYHYSVDMLYDVVEEMKHAGIISCILFGIPNEKDACGSQAYHPNGVVQQAARELKRLYPELIVIGDVCMCEYTDHGHCGILDANGVVQNDVTLEYLAKIAVSYAQAGMDMVAPSDMMDGRVLAIRKALDEAGYYNLPIMSYSAKFASSYYGPFRAAANSAPSFGDRKSYQMDWHNGKEAIREVEADLQEGADIIMVKPAMAYLDVIKEVSLHTNCPICAYQVSGEYAMLKMAVEQGIMNENVIMESLIAIKRAGANMIITYFALEIAKRL